MNTDRVSHWLGNRDSNGNRIVAGAIEIVRQVCLDHLYWRNRSGGDLYQLTSTLGETLATTATPREGRGSTAGTQISLVRYPRNGSHSAIPLASSLTELRPGATYRVSVVIAAFADERWLDTVAAVESVHAQTDPPIETILVIDHNPSLMKRARRELTGVHIVENTGVRGASGARNSGVLVSGGDIIVFLDDDAVASSNWLRNLCQHFIDPDVIGVGGGITPAWQTARPRWFPREFDWVVGASYCGMPEVASPVRNIWSGNMAVRRTAFEAVDGFRAGFGKTGNLSRPEDTDLCLRIARAHPDGHWLYEPAAEIAHKVPAGRSTRRFFLKRCWHEGRGKAALSSLVGISDGTSAERDYAMRLPRAVIREVSGAAVRRELAALERSFAIIIGLIVTAAGLATEMIVRAKPHTFQYSAARAATGSVLGAIRGHKMVRESGRYNGDVGDAHRNYSLCTRLATSVFRRVQLAEWELTKPAPHLSLEPPGAPPASAHVRLLVRMNTEPLGYADIEYQSGETFSEIAARRVWELLSDVINDRLCAAGQQELTELPASGLNVEISNSPYLARRTQLLSAAPLISVVVATRNRPDQLTECLRRLAAQRYPNFEIVVVDNAPTSLCAVPDMLSKWNIPVAIRYVLEMRPGLAWARNSGWRTASGDLIAFLDDDEIADDLWLAELLRGFAVADNVGCVSGMILPAALDTQAQEWFEQFGGHSKGRGFTQAVFEPGRGQSPLYPLPPFGAGGNMAFRRETLLDIDGFNVALGAGTASRGGEDTFAFTRALLARHRMVYQPSAFVWHNHYDDAEGLVRQMHGYGRGLTAFYAAVLCHNPRLLFPLLCLVPTALRDLRGKNSIRTEKMRDFPPELIREQRRGMAVGAFAYMASVCAQRSKRCHS
jgi:GT2 family glycosyltransferase